MAVCRCAAALVYGSAIGRTRGWSSCCHPTTASDRGAPSPNIRFRTFTAILVSVSCAPGPFVQARAQQPTKHGTASTPKSKIGGGEVRPSPLDGKAATLQRPWAASLYPTSARQPIEE